LTNHNKYNELFSKKGFFVIEKLLTKNFVKKILKEIYEAKNTDKYFDSKKNLRRVERLYNKGKTLKILNSKILFLLNKIFKENFLIFKDKFNAKPTGGYGFFAHFDGVFQFVIQKNVKKNGWYEYSDFFINVLIALDECNKKNGSIELSKSHKGNFNDLLKKTKNNGTPALNNNTLYKTKFNLINLKIGDVVFFSNTCPHQSKKN